MYSAIAAEYKRTAQPRRQPLARVPARASVIAAHDREGAARAGPGAAERTRTGRSAVAVARHRAQGHRRTRQRRTAHAAPWRGNVRGRSHRQIVLQAHRIHRRPAHPRTQTARAFPRTQHRRSVAGRSARPASVARFARDPPAPPALRRRQTARAGKYRCAAIDPARSESDQIIALRRARTHPLPADARIAAVARGRARCRTGRSCSTCKPAVRRSPSNAAHSSTTDASSNSPPHSTAATLTISLPNCIRKNSHESGNDRARIHENVRRGARGGRRRRAPARRQRADRARSGATPAQRIRRASSSPPRAAVPITQRRSRNTCSRRRSACSRRRRRRR